MESTKSLEGIMVPLITPFDDDGTLAPEKALPLIERHLEVGVQGFYVGGSTGEGFLQSVVERREFLGYVAEATKQRITLIAQVGALSSQDAWTLADYAAEYGYDIVSSTPPFYYNYSEQEIVAYYQELAKRSPLPVLLYNSPGTTGRNLSIDVQIEMLRLPNIIGSKHTETNLYVAERLMSNVKGTQIINGPDEMLTGGLAMGLVGGIGSTYNLMPRHYLDIYRHVMNGDLEKAQASQSVVNAVIYELLRISPGVVSGIKLGLKILGYDVGSARKPFQPISADTSRFEQLLIECDGL